MLFEYLHLNLNPVSQFEFNRSPTDILDEAELAISELVMAMGLKHYLFANVSLAAKMTFGTYSDNWIRHYRESRLVLRDPVAQYVIRGNGQPLLWSECPFVSGTNAEPINLARKYLGVTDGLIIPGKFHYCLSLSGNLPQLRMIELRNLAGEILQNFVTRLSLVAATDNRFVEKMQANHDFFRSLKSGQFRKV